MQRCARRCRVLSKGGFARGVSSVISTHETERCRLAAGKVISCGHSSQHTEDALCRKVMTDVIDAQALGHTRAARAARCADGQRLPICNYHPAEHCNTGTEHFPVLHTRHSRPR